MATEDAPAPAAAPEAKEETRVIRGIACLVHYKPEFEGRDQAKTLKITVHPKWFTKHVREALIGPFVQTYNRTVRKGETHRHLDPFMMRCAAVDGSRIEGNEEIGDVVRYLASKRPDGVAEMFLVDQHYTAALSWRHGLKQLEAGEAAPRLSDSPAVFAGADAGAVLASPPAPVGLEKTKLAKSRYTKPGPCGNKELATLGDRARALLEDPEASYVEVRAACGRWLNTVDSVENALACVDERGRTLLHCAVGRGDAKLCSDMAKIGDGAMVIALDEHFTTPIMDAALFGRTLVLEEILKAPCVTHEILNERNFFLMSALQLSCCDDGQGNPRAAALLVEAGADPNARCWDKTPLMAACASEHVEMITTLVEELGADLMLRNGEMHMAMDYCKVNETAEFLFKLMEGHFLMNKAAPSYVHEASSSQSRAPGSREDDGPRYFSWTKNLPLADAFAALGVDVAGLDDFKKDGAHAGQLRSNWRRLVLQYHPDKRPANWEDLPEDYRRKWSGKFHAVQRAYEAIEAHLLALERQEEIPADDPEEFGECPDVGRTSCYN